MQTINCLKGEINVTAVMERQARLKWWQQRQARDVEWQALKQWWRAERQLRQARTQQQCQEARQALRNTARLYRAELRRAWPKWHRAQEELAARRKNPYL